MDASASRANLRKKWSASSRRKHAKRKANGMCIHCGTRPVIVGKTQCIVCSGKNKLRSERDKDKVLAHYGKKCKCCGESNKKFLTVDHTNNDGGGKHRPMGGVREAIKLGFPTNLQILCFNCNVGKHLNKGICPHQESCHASVC